MAELEKIFLNRNKKKSIETLSSIVFGIALSIGTFTFIAADTGLVLANIVTFAFSFLVLIYIWLRYTKILDIIRVETTFELLLNILLLFFVIIEPYLFNQVQISALPAATSAVLGGTSFLFGLDIAGLMFVLAAIYVLGLRNYRDVRKDIVAHYNHIRNALLIIGTLFVIADLPFFWVPYHTAYQPRFVIWGLSIILVLVLKWARDSGRLDKLIWIRGV